MLSINFLVSLLEKNWHNIMSLHVKSTMGEPIRQILSTCTTGRPPSTRFRHHPCLTL
ncbi:hypothetical protein AURDEDRAFT_167818 [Auricularia subglabra TFB-10046 SS5]|nr:hypothetical protein AURDEDRAFT_167818 [Auricularia subglabra TFB-10046 SS5]